MFKFCEDGGETLGVGTLGIGCCCGSCVFWTIGVVVLEQGICVCAAVVFVVGIVCKELLEEKFKVERWFCCRAVTLCGMDASTKGGIGAMIEALTCGGGT